VAEVNEILEIASCNQARNSENADPRQKRDASPNDNVRDNDTYDSNYYARRAYQHDTIMAAISNHKQKYESDCDYN